MVGELGSQPSSRSPTCPAINRRDRVKRETYFCDYCKNPVSSGFQLGVLGTRPRGSATLERDAHFCGLDCLVEWSLLASDAAKTLEADALSLSPRGRLTSKSVSVLCVD